MIYKSEGEHQLTKRAINQQPNGDIVGLEEVLHKDVHIVYQEDSSQHGGKQQYNLQQWVYTLPNTFFVEVPQVDVVGDELPEDDGEVVPKPTIDQEEPRADDAEHPIEYGRLHLATLLGDNPCSSSKYAESIRRT